METLGIIHRANVYPVPLTSTWSPWTLDLYLEPLPTPHRGYPIVTG